ncbi:hypothetical protein GCM10007939_02130 [Amylibacter marinus]|uniref:Uncharacterized protein n=1 Tax=Amylibacter marinus TaxID=1475483 RepID=A0ABQ5VRG2_9RHOB|nr:hypothetical protein [Amylibacter marinus]GLQ33930.1 hypothetical protein GCM10007939_02130 [Amylibacter marinus]
MNTDYTQDHKVIEGAQATRRYFAKFSRIIEHLAQVTDLSQDEGLISGAEAQVLEGYLLGLSNTFTALSYKFLMANRVGSHLGKVLSIDRSDSGFPIFQELVQMAADTVQAEVHLNSLPSQEQLKKDMVNHILTEQRAPVQLQYALSQRIYYEYLAQRQLFYSQNDPHIIWTGGDDDRRKYLIYWANYDSQTNLPVIYLMEVEDTGRKALARDERRWPRVQAHLMAQAVSGLKLLTIARGFDQDFDHLHPKKLRRFHIGPMYSHTFTEQAGPLREVLADASGEAGLDWALTWGVETLRSARVSEEKSGFFSTVERQVFDVDTMRAGLQGVSDARRSLILPHRAFQVLEEKDPPTLRDTRKYVVGKNAKIISYK